MECDGSLDVVTLPASNVSSPFDSTFARECLAASRHRNGYNHPHFTVEVTDVQKVEFLAPKRQNAELC